MPDEEEERMEITEEEMRKLQHQRAEKQSREQEEARKEAEFQQQFMQIPPEKKIPTDTDVQLAAELMKVKGGTARQHWVVPVKDDKGKIVGKDVIETKNVFYEIISEDMTKSNLNINDLAVVRGLCMRSNHTQAISRAFTVDLSPTQKVLADAVLVFLTSSRGKGGWAAMLSKTDKTITQQSLEQFSKQMQEEKKKKWGLF